MLKNLSITIFLILILLFTSCGTSSNTAAANTMPDPTPIDTSLSPNIDTLTPCDITLIDDERGKLVVTGYGQNPQFSSEFLVQIDFESETDKLNVTDVFANQEEILQHSFLYPDTSDQSITQLAIRASDVSMLTFTVELQDIETGELFFYPGVYIYPDRSMIDYPNEPLLENETAQFTLENIGSVPAKNGETYYVIDVHTENLSDIKYSYYLETISVNGIELECTQYNSLVLYAGQSGQLHSTITPRDLEALGINDMQTVTFVLDQQPMGDADTQVIGDNMTPVGTYTVNIADAIARTN